VNGKFAGKFVLSVEHDTEAGVPWFGNLTVPDDKWVRQHKGTKPTTGILVTI
jgi:hypothetical protein